MEREREREGMKEEERRGEQEGFRCCSPTSGMAKRRETEEEEEKDEKEQKKVHKRELIPNFFHGN